MKKEQRLLKDTLTYMVANFGSKILLLVIYPIYTYFILPEELGVYDLIVSTMTLVYPIVVFSINDALFRWLLDNDRLRQSKVIAVALRITLRNLLAVNILYTALNLIFAFSYGWYILAVLNFGALYPVFQQAARGLGRNKLFAVSGLLYAVSLVLLNLVLVLALGMKVEGLLLSQAAAYGISCVFLLVFLPELRSKWWHEQPDPALKKEMTRYSLLLIPNSSCWWIMNASDRYLIRLFLGDAANGIYAVSHKFPSVMNMLTSVFSMAWQEQAITEFDSGERDGYYSRIHRFYYRLLFCASLMLIPVTKWFTVWFIESEYVSSWHYSGALYLGSVFLALATFLGTGYLSAKNTRGSMVTSMVGAAVNLVADLILLPVIGLEAAALSTLMGNFGVWLSRWWQSKKYFKIRVCWPEFIALAAANIAVGLLVRATSLPADIFLTAAAAVLTLALNWQTPREFLKK